MKEEIWIEKYRPYRLEDVVGQSDTIERLRSYIKTNNLPHLLFSGPPGVGKTATAVSIARELFGDDWRENFTELNASDERGIDVVRTKIKNFAKTSPIGGADFKIIFLDEADALTPDAQSALRRTMERYTNNCRFILSCNYSSKIIEPIQSRCAVYRFRPLSDDAIGKRCRHIAEKEGLDIADDGIEAIKYVAEGDMRKAINAVQAASMFDSSIHADSIYRITATAHPEEIKALLESALGGNFISSRKKLEDLMVLRGLSGEDVVGQVYRSLFDIDMPARKLVSIVDVLGEIDFRITEGADERIQLDALLAHLSIEGEE
ncbi:replication factor C small subunit [Methanohalophilus portucalensis]|uniref:Replication factor C small subunit n=2 Tax=Methanohalophilus portucalensis TaxID=39664 RepID=A0A1L9C3E3_9EURY|nr:replication factor C small subunit [Methanohalophilus portucalensis]ATU07542.1 Replication factor C small subunit [Methanohalophilus portucalensis]OJH48983.1 replication factor C small subunit [Methanohalophilus portucalensis FDF-1]RNI10272.1 replication factor C small subunit [Methanohalophilus portucalensis FDF-1]SMH38179.1 replication factor C small subunit [Methanohalophilus portucalensis FDF-1]